MGLLGYKKIWDTFRPLLSVLGGDGGIFFIHVSWMDQDDAVIPQKIIKRGENLVFL